MTQTIRMAHEYALPTVMAAFVLCQIGNGVVALWRERKANGGRKC